MEWLLKEFKGAIGYNTISRAFEWAAEGGHLKIMEWLLREFKGAINDEDKRRAFGLAARGGHLKIMKWLLREFESAIDDETIRWAFEEAAGGGGLEIVEFFVATTPYNNIISKDDVDKAIEESNENGHDNIVRYLVGKKHLFGNKEKEEQKNNS